LKNWEYQKSFNPAFSDFAQYYGFNLQALPLTKNFSSLEEINLKLQIW